MSAIVELKTLLGQAYDLDVVKSNKKAAIELLRKAIATAPDLQAAAVKEKNNLAGIVARRGARACHITNVTLALLEAALR